MKQPSPHNPKPTILLTIDVEDWFQVENFKPWIPFSSWDERELRVEKNVHRLLDLFDSVGGGQRTDDRGQRTEDRRQRAEDRRQRAEGRGQTTEGRGQRAARPINQSTQSSYQPISPINQSTNQFINPTNPANPNTGHQTPNTRAPAVRGTFFVLGWIAARLPGLVREIRNRGHEVASHGADHELPTKMSEKCLVNDLCSSRKTLEDMLGAPVYGYRAPSFSIDDRILGLIREAGYLYDSSYNSFSLHGRYGRINLNGDGKVGGLVQITEDFFEIPVSNLTLFSRVLPWGGGAYFRLLPLTAFTMGARRILKKQGVYTMYLHPWEVDPGQPRVAAATLQRKVRHYTHLDRTEERLERFVGSFEKMNFCTAFEHIMENQNPIVQTGGM